MAARAPVPFSLHCTICYEAFDPIERPPVILPCGHTYLCSACSKRLKTCMECRTPLYTYPPRSPTLASSSSHSPGFRPPGTPRRHSPRARSSPGTTSSKTTGEPVPLPIPRNIVLISMLEAAKQTVGLPDEDTEKGYESGDDDEQVLEGMRLVSSDYGTYVVRDRNGLVLHEAPPGSPTADKENQDRDLASQSLTESLSREEEEKDTQAVSGGKVPMDSSSGGGSFDANISSAFRKLSTPSQQDQGMRRRLSFGQTVQIISFEDGLAKLARGRGYLVATDDQLVKIGDSKDEACKYEGMLSHLNQQKQELMKKLSALEKSEAELSQNLLDAMKVEEPEPFAMAPGVDYKVDGRSETPPPPSGLELSPDSSPEATTPAQQALPRQLSAVGGAPSFPDLGPTEFDDFVLAVTTAAREQDVQIQEAEPGSLTCTDFLPAFLGHDELPQSPPLRASSGRQGVAEEAVDRIEAAHGVNFRTGLSGHMALTSATSHADRRGSPSLSYVYQPRLMSQTNGISRTRKIRPRNGNESAHTLGNPTW